MQIKTEDKKYSFGKAAKFNYLDITLTREGEEKSEIQKSVAKVRNERPTVLYGCELWKLNTQEMDTLEIFKRRVLRGKEIQKEWRRRTNEE